jgi:hypothetical protein
MPWIGKTVAAETGLPHQVDILGIMTVSQMAHKTAEGLGGNAVVECVKRIILVHIHSNRPWFVLHALP